jgi:uncharacterized protein YdeI (BOF family)
MINRRINLQKKVLILVVMWALVISILAAGQGRTSGRGSRNTSRSTPQREQGEQPRPTGAHLSPAQQQNINRLATDLNAIKQGSQVTQAQKNALKNDLLAMADGATRPDPALVQQLANDLAGAMSDGQLSSREKTKLTQDLYQVMNSANISVAEVNQAIADAQAILQASGINRAAAQTIASDLKAIAAEAQKNAQGAAGQRLRRKQK